MQAMDELIRQWGGLAVVSRYDQPTSSWIFIALHDDTLGPPVGGTRMKVYPSPAAGLVDAMRLAEGMTHKWAALKGDYGGGKAVLALSRELSSDERSGLLGRYGRLLGSLRGAFSTGPDLGTSPEDMVVLARYSAYVHGVEADGSAAKDPSPFTALGVWTGIRAAIRHVDRRDSLESVTVLIQGVGHVGAELARLVAGEGARVLVNDADAERARRVAAAVGGETIPADELYTTPCDVYAPCAVGATLDRETVATLRCRVVAGAANNQLAEAGDADRLHERGILYAPDYVINAGGALAIGQLERDSTDAQRRDQVVAIGDALGEIFDESASQHESPVHAARRLVARALHRASSGDQAPAPGID